MTLAEQLHRSVTHRKDRPDPACPLCCRCSVCDGAAGCRHCCYTGLAEYMPGTPLQPEPPDVDPLERAEADEERYYSSRRRREP